MSRQHKTQNSTQKASSSQKQPQFTSMPVIQPRTIQKPDPQLPEWKPEGSGAVSPLARLQETAALQAKLTIGQPHDKYEQEADLVARDVVQRIHAPLSDATQQLTHVGQPNSSTIQRDLNDLVDNAREEADKTTDKKEIMWGQAHGKEGVQQTIETGIKKGEKAFMNCWDGAFYLCWKANILPKKTIDKLYQDVDDFREILKENNLPPEQNLSEKSVFVNAPIRKLISFNDERKLNNTNPTGVNVGDFILFEENKGDLSHVAVATAANEVVHLWTVTESLYDGFQRASVQELIDRYSCLKAAIAYNKKDDEGFEKNYNESYKSRFETKRDSIFVYACTPPWITHPNELTNISEQVMAETKTEIKETYNLDDDQLEKQTSNCCYITTACVRSRGLSDNCHELTILRKFREEYMRNLKHGATLIETYYQYAPTIVAAIDQSPDAQSIYESLYTVIQGCVRQIQQKQFSSALKTYIDMVLTLGVNYAPHFVLPHCLMEEEEAELEVRELDNDGEDR